MIERLLPGSVNTSVIAPTELRISVEFGSTVTFGRMTNGETL